MTDTWGSFSGAVTHLRTWNGLSKSKKGSLEHCRSLKSPKTLPMFTKLVDSSSKSRLQRLEYFPTTPAVYALHTGRHLVDGGGTARCSHPSSHYLSLPVEAGAYLQPTPWPGLDTHYLLSHTHLHPLHAFISNQRSLYSQRRKSRGALCISTVIQCHKELRFSGNSL